MEDRTGNRVGSVLAPGMQDVIQAGETWEIKDTENKTIAIKAVESEEVMEFLKAFDTWLTTKNAKVTGVVLDAADADMTKKFNNLPMRIQQEMPSFAALGIRIPHAHG